MNAAAIKAWESKSKGSAQHKHNRSTRRAKRKRRGTKSGRLTKFDVAVEDRNQIHLFSSGESSHTSSTNAYRTRSGIVSKSRFQANSLIGSNPSKITVQVSQRSSRDQLNFIPYKSSNSDRESLSGPSQSSKFISEGFLRQIDTSSSSITQRCRIIPDSQPLPGSSSFVPTSSESADSIDTLFSGSVSGKSTSRPLHLDTSIVAVSTPDNSVRILLQSDSTITQISGKSTQDSATTPVSSSANRFSLSVLTAHIPLPADKFSNYSSNDTAHQEESAVIAVHSDEYRLSIADSEVPSCSSSLPKSQQSPEIQVQGSFHQFSDRSIERVTDSDTLEPGFVSQTQIPSETPEQRHRDQSPSRVISEKHICGVSATQTHSTDFQTWFDNQKEAAGSPSNIQGNLNTLKVSVDQNHPSQATTTDETIYSSEEADTEAANPNYLDNVEIDTFGLTGESRIEVWDSVSPNQLTTIRADSRVPPSPPVFTQSEMSSNPTDPKAFPGASKDTLGTKEKVLKLREEAAIKREAVRAGRGQFSPSSSRPPPLGAEEKQLPQLDAEQAPPFSALGRQQQPSPASQRLPPLAMAMGQQSTPQFSHAYPSLPGARESTISSPSQGYPIQDPNRNGAFQPWLPPSRNSPTSGRTEPFPSSPIIRNASTSNRIGNPQPLSPTPWATTVDRDARVPSTVQSPSNQETYRTQVQSPGLPKSRAGTHTPEVIPDKVAYQVQEEPERLQVQPALISTELPLPMRTSQSLPHTPATPSRLSMHNEISPSQTSTLVPKNLGNMEFIVPLCMQKRILQQYVETIKYYPAAIKEILTQSPLNEKSIGALNELLCRLANVSIHIGLEGGGPSSQDSVQASQEASYAEVSSEKFRFLSILFQLLRNDDLHIALVAQPGHLHDIVELFLKGKRVHYNRPGTYSKSNLGPGNGRLHVSLIASTEEGFTTHLTRSADLVIALDETFKAENQTIIDLRKSRTNLGRLTPVIRLIIFSTVEHFDLCLSRTLEPIDRLRKLIFCVLHTQEFVGELQSDHASTQESADSIATFLRRGGQPWPLPRIKPIENLPMMDSDSSLSDAMSDVSAKVGRPNELVKKYWPDRDHAMVGISSTQVLSSGKRPFVSMTAELDKIFIHLLTITRILSTAIV